MSASSSGGPLAALSDDLAAAVDTVGRSVVAIHARRRIPASGVVWQPGVIVAAHHTIQRDDDITITLHDGTTTTATLAGRDPSTDLAVLRLADGSGAPAAAAADGAPRVGQLVLALGRPGTTVTASLGIVSAVGGEWRTWQGGAIDRFIRLDLSVYDGFSGGPLVDAGGRVRRHQHLGARESHGPHRAREHGGTRHGPAPGARPRGARVARHRDPAGPAAAAAAA